MDELMKQEIAQGEGRALAVSMADAYRGIMAHHLNDLKLSPEAHHLQVKKDNARLLWVPLHELSWWDMASLLEEDPSKAASTWAQMKEAAQNELASGMRASKVLERLGVPWNRAQFLAVRDAFIEEWQPRGGVELTLIDMMAQAYSEWLYWLEHMHDYATTEDALPDSEVARREGRWLPPRLGIAQSIDQAAAMADRFNRLFVRTLRQLRDLRRYTPTVTIQNAEQVNIAAEGGKQVNQIGDRSLSE